MYLPLFAVISNAFGTSPIPCNTCVMVGFNRTRPVATRRTVCSRCACVLMSGNRYRRLRWRSVSMSSCNGWPKNETPPNEKAWDESIAAFQSDLKEMEALVEDPKTDLFARIAWGDGQTILREALLVADHNAYHLGQIVLLRRMVGAWGKKS